MPPKKGGLGRGFDALFADNSVEEAEEGKSVISLRLNDIEPNKNQPRQVFDDDAISELADSISEHGVLQPLIVRPLADGSYQLVAGERRWRASRLAGLTEVPVIVRSLTDSEVAVIALIENLQREDLNPIEEAEGISRLIEEYSFTQEQAAQKIAALGLSVRQAELLCKNMSKEPAPEKEPTLAVDYIAECEKSLSKQLGRGVRIVNGKRKGRFELEYYGQEDLQVLLDALMKIER